MNEQHTVAIKFLRAADLDGVLRIKCILLKPPAKNLNHQDSRRRDFVIHPVWEDGSCQHLCHQRSGRGFSGI